MTTTAPDVAVSTPGAPLRDIIDFLLQRVGKRTPA